MEISFTKNNGEIVDRKYVRRRVVQRCGAKVARVTVDNDKWLRGRNGMLAAAVAREAELDSWMAVEVAQ